MPTLIFDVNETLLDIDALAPLFERLFDQLGGAVLRMMGTIRGIHVPDGDIQLFKEAVATMPAHAEVRAALQRLRTAGFRMFTLTNNPKATCENQLRNAGIAELFDGQFSVDEGVRRYKPAREVYRMVEQTLSIAPEQLWLIACHTWDILGASAAGWKTALVLRSGNAPLSVGGQPLITGVDLADVADKLLEHRPSLHP
jgi:2-haloacid dehalogenase